MAALRAGHTLGRLAANSSLTVPRTPQGDSLSLLPSSTLPAVQSSWVLTQCQSLVRPECVVIRAVWKDTQHSGSHLLLREPGQTSAKQNLQLDHKVGGGMNGWGGEDEGKDLLGGRSCLGKGDEIGHT